MNSVYNQKQRAVELRQHYLIATRKHLEEILWHSLDGNKEAHDKSMEQLETALLILWRFDRKIQNLKALETLDV